MSEEVERLDGCMLREQTPHHDVLGGKAHIQNRDHIINKVMKSYKRLQSQGHVKKWHTVAARLMLIACLVAESIQR